MAWPTAILTYKDGSEFEVNAGNVPDIFATLPTDGLVRVDFNPPAPGRKGNFELVHSGAQEYWAYKEGANQFVFGYHNVSTLFFDPPANTLPNPNGTPEKFGEIVYDKRPNRDPIERMQTEIPAAALVVING